MEKHQNSKSGRGQGMVDINKFLTEGNRETHRTESISLSGKLEAFIGHYFVWGESGAEACWLIVYYNPNTFFLRRNYVLFGYQLAS